VAALDRPKALAMAEAAHGAGRTGAAERVAEVCLELAGARA
ncbi:MAG: UDP-N-acetylglucosamine--N-acetylmuramyl-(pentapeptide) pyrophosphoryl-undecaprenol N-acetylglucosamine transferase, partial [Betaproteobacteria bacterium PRO3]|nr:UDP-N-acetylglucosamine--N-acetylmuramyl-(pentapeptide) pyrophosphoryl-undecaprenol N-acetylglucosamine transferase [Betaproteobacteria bacterium PRO3]